MEIQEKQIARFSVSKNHLGVTSIVDATKNDGKGRGVIAIFFQDEHYPARAEMYAKVCSAALNQEAARRAHKE